MKTVRIAIDGPSGAGKSTMAKAVAKELGILYLDTGSMYRTTALNAIRKGVDLADREQVIDMMQDTFIQVLYENGHQRVLLNGEDVSDLIRTNEVSMGASKVSIYPEVRRKMVELQQEIATNGSVVMDGRDIGTHVLPNADVKIFLTASAADRANRRYLELQEKGLLDRTYAELLSEIETRDYNDSNRKESPLRQAEDAIRIDTTGLEVEESIAQILQLVKARV